MPLVVTDAAHAYLADPAIRASVDEVLAYDSRKSLRLPWDEARELARARMMAEVARAEVVELLFGLWEAIWTEARPALGQEPAEDSEDQYSFIYKDVWENQCIERAFKAVATRDRFFELGIYIDTDESIIVIGAYCLKGGEYRQWPSVPGWRRRAGNDEEDLAEGLICEEPIPFSALRDDLEARLAAVRRCVAALIPTLEAWPGA